MFWSLRNECTVSARVSFCQFFSFQFFLRRGRSPDPRPHSSSVAYTWLAHCRRRKVIMMDDFDVSFVILSAGRRNLSVLTLPTLGWERDFKLLNAGNQKHFFILTEVRCEFSAIWENSTRNFWQKLRMICRLILTFACCGLLSVGINGEAPDFSAWSEVKQISYFSFTFPCLKDQERIHTMRLQIIAQEA